MPEASRSDAPLRDPQYPQIAEPEEFSPQQPNVHRSPATETRFPPGDIYGQLPATRLESFGRSVGSAVGGVLRFPERVGQATSRLRKAGSTTRAEASAAMLEMMDTAAQRAEYLRDNTEALLSDLARTARTRTARLEDQAAERWDQVRSAAQERLDLASRRAAAQWNDSRQAVIRMRREDPARFLMVVAGAAFVIGAGVRIWRANRNG